MKFLGTGCLSLLDGIQSIRSLTAYFHILFFLLCVVVRMVVCFVCFYLNLYIVSLYRYVYVFLLLYIIRFSFSVSWCCFVYCLCVNVNCTTATGCQPRLIYQIYKISNTYHGNTSLYAELSPVHRYITSFFIVRYLQLFCRKIIN